MLCSICSPYNISKLRDSAVKYVRKVYPKLKCHAVENQVNDKDENVIRCVAKREREKEGEKEREREKERKT